MLFMMVVIFKAYKVKVQGIYEIKKKKKKKLQKNPKY